jgi:hypothetical protein
MNQFLENVRKEIPRYADIPDDELITHIHNKYYSQVPFEEFAKAAKYDDPETAPGTIGNLGLALTQGVVGVGGGVGDVLERTGIAPETGRYLQNNAMETMAKGDRSKSFEWQQDAAQPLLDESNNLNPEFGLTAIADSVAQSLPGMIASAPVGGLLARATGAGRKAAGAGKELSETVGSALGFGAAEGQQAASQNAMQTAYEIRNTPFSKLADSEAFKQAYWSQDDSVPHEQRMDNARESIATQAGNQVFVTTMATTGGIGAATGGGVLGMIRNKRLLNKAADESFKAATLKGIKAEAGQEFWQSGFEALNKNIATRDFVDQNQDIYKNVANQALTGAVVGGVMGTMGGVSAIGRAKTADEAIDAFGQAMDQPTRVDIDSKNEPVLNWDVPTSKIIPNADAIVRNRTVPGRDLQSSIDARFNQNTDYIPGDQGQLWEAPNTEQANQKAEKNRAFYEAEQADLQRKADELRYMEAYPNATKEQVKQYRTKRIQLETEKRQRADEFRANLGYNLIPYQAGKIENKPFSNLGEILRPLADAIPSTQQEAVNEKRQNAKQEANANAGQKERLLNEVTPAQPGVVQYEELEREAIQQEDSVLDSQFYNSIPFPQQTRKQIAEEWEAADLLNDQQPVQQRSESDQAARRRLLTPRIEQGQSEFIPTHILTNDNDMPVKQSGKDTYIDQQGNEYYEPDYAAPIQQSITPIKETRKTKQPNVNNANQEPTAAQPTASGASEDSPGIITAGEQPSTEELVNPAEAPTKKAINEQAKKQTESKTQDETGGAQDTLSATADGDWVRRNVPEPQIENIKKRLDANPGFQKNPEIFNRYARTATGNIPGSQTIDFHAAFTPKIAEDLNNDITQPQDIANAETGVPAQTERGGGRTVKENLTVDQSNQEPAETTVLINLQRELNSLLEKRSDMRTKHMEKYRNHSATRAQTTTHNARVSQINERVEWLRSEIKRKNNEKNIQPATLPERGDDSNIDAGIRNTAKKNDIDRDISESRKAQYPSVDDSDDSLDVKRTDNKNEAVTAGNVKGSGEKQQDSETVDVNDSALNSVAEQDQLDSTAKFYYTNGEMGMKPDGAFTKDKSKWAVFDNDEASRIDKPYGATSTGIFTHVETGQVLRKSSVDKITEQPRTQVVEKDNNQSNELFSKEDIPYEYAARAYMGISHSPEKRAQQEQDGYVTHMQNIYDSAIKYAKTDEQRAIINAAFIKYKDGFIQKTLAYLSAKSRVMSPMITGPANFPVARNNKANATERKRLEELLEWDKKAKGRLIGIARDSRTLEEKNNERQEAINKRIASSLDTIKGIDDGTVRGSSRPLFVSSITGTIKTLSKNGETELVNGALDFIENFQKGFAKPLITKNNSIWDLRDKTNEAKLEIKKEKGIVELKVYDGATVVNNHELDRVQILFEEKPSNEVRDALKKAAFKWSPNNNAWQRQNTSNGINAATNILDGLYQPKDNKFSKTQLTSGSTVADIKSWLPSRVKRMVTAGKLRIDQSHGNDQVEAYYDSKNDVVVLIADKITKDSLNSVLSHELVHRALSQDPKLKAAYDRFMSDLQHRFNLASRGVGTGAETSAYGRVIAAETPAKDQIEEYAAYLVSEWQKAPKSVSSAIRKAIDDFVASIRAFLIRNGLDLGFIKSLTPADLAAMSKYGANVKSRGLNSSRENGVLTSAKADRFYSALKRAFIAAPDKVFSNSQQVKLWINSNAAKYDVKKDEIYWSGLNEWIDTIPGKLSRDDVLSFLNQNGVQVEDVVLDNNLLDAEIDERVEHMRELFNADRQKKIDDDVEEFEEDYYVDSTENENGKKQWYVTDGYYTDDDDYFDSKGEAIYLRDELNEKDRDAFQKKIESKYPEFDEEEARQEAMEKVEKSDNIGPKHNTAQLTLPGGTDYRELVVTIPTTEKYNESDTTHFGDVGGGKQIAWIRHNTRIDADGNKGLFLEEAQSQRSQSGRKDGFSFKRDKWEAEFKNGDVVYFNNKADAYKAEKQGALIKQVVVPGVPPAPFITDNNNRATNAYITLLMKKAVSSAIDNGQSFVSWTTGDQQSDRYDLSKQVDTIMYNESAGRLMAFKGSSPIIEKNGITPGALPDYIGKEVTENLLSSEQDSKGIRRIEGQSLKVGGGWTQAMYGNEQGLNAQGKSSLIMQAANELARKFGGEVGSVKIGTGMQPALIITKQMRDKILNEGMPLFSFAGRKALTADKYALSTAQQRLDNGDDAETIRQDTGWFKGVDNRWRFEIDDSEASIKKPFPTKGQLWGDTYELANKNRVEQGKSFGLKLSDIIDHPKLFAAYPYLQELSVTSRNKDGASFVLKTNYDAAYISIGKDVPMYDVMTTLLHEVQHAIQIDEGFAEGGSASDSNLPSAMELAQKVNDKYEIKKKEVRSSKKYIEFIENFIDSYPEKDRYTERRGNSFDKAKDDAESKAYYNFIEPIEDERLKKVNEILGDGADFLGYKNAAYKRLAGEVEARNTQSRQNLTVEQRRNTPPNATQDIADDDVIVVWNGKEMSNSKKSIPETIAIDGKERPTRNSNGQFISNTEEGIRYSKALDTKLEGVKNTVHDLMHSPSVWGPIQKNLGTQYAKAEASPEYRKFWERTHAMFGDQNRATSRPADLAPNILPKYTFKDIAESVKTIATGGKYGNISQEDLTAAHNALTVGTLWGGGNPLEGRLFSDNELRNGIVDDKTGELIKLTDSQIAIYKEFRQTVDASITETSASEMWKVASYVLSDNEKLRSFIADNPQKAKEILTQSLREVADSAEANTSAGNDVEDNEKILDAIDTALDEVNRLAQRSKDLIANGYTPLMRFGNYKITVTNEKDRTSYVARYDSAFAANRDKRRLMEAFTDEAGYTVSDVSIENPDKWKLFKDVNPDSIMLFAEASGIDKDDIMQSWYKEALSNRSALKRMIHRKGYAGFSTDMPRTLAAFITSNGKRVGNNYHASKLQRMIFESENGEVQKEMQDLLAHISNDGSDIYSKMRGFMATWYILGSVASATVNATQPITMTFPRLFQDTTKNTESAATLLTKAYHAIIKPELLSDDLVKALHRAEQDGTVDSAEVYHLYEEAIKPMINKLGSGRAARTLSAAKAIWSAPYSIAEYINRKATFIAAYNLATQKGMKGDEAFKYAEKIINETQGIYGKHNRVNLSREGVGSMTMVFKQFSITYLEMLIRMAKSGPEGKKAAALALGVLLLAGGLAGAPFEDDLEDLIDSVAQSVFGKAFVTRVELRKQLEKTMSREAADLILYGITTKAPFDLSGRYSMGNLIPGTGLLKPSEKYPEKELASFLGAPGSFVSNIVDASRAVMAGEGSKAAKLALPRAMGDVIKASEILASGEIKDMRGRKIADADYFDGILQSAGFNPQTKARKMRIEYPVNELLDYRNAVESSIAKDWARAIADKDQKGVKEARSRLSEWNDKNPKMRIVIRQSQIHNRVKRLKEERGVGVIKRAPKEVRQDIAELMR